MNNIPKMIYIGPDSYQEKFKQIKIDGMYIPYVISNFGRLFSLFYNKSKESDNFNIHELKLNSNNTKYNKITIYYNGKHYNCWIHRLVALSFIKKPKGKNEVNHIDGNPKNNSVWNLEWVDHMENIHHAEKNHLINHAYGENNHSTYTEETVIKVCEMIKNNIPPKIIRDETLVSKNVFQSILHKRKWKYITNTYNFDNYKYLRKNKKKNKS